MQRAPVSKTRSLVLCFAAYAGGAVAAAAAGRLAGDRLILAALLADLAATIVVFAFSFGLDNSSLYDPYWSVAPIAIAGFWLVRTGAGGVMPRQVLLLALLAAWGLRLTMNWALRWEGLHDEDWRYVEFRKFGRMYWPVSFLAIHLFPTAIVFLGCLALFPALGAGARPFGVLDIAAAVVTASAIAVEWTADRQLRRFLAEKVRAGHPATLEKGLWALSRHPNYFGEVLFWWGLWLFGLAAAPAWWWTVAGPVAMTAMFLGVSIPWMDRHLQARRPGYAEVIRRRSSLVPWFPTSAPAGSRSRRTTR
jgi:steroid 5-alpha reductase family enzyme